MMKIEIKNVSKRYGSVYALKNVSLTLEEKKIYGLLGRNGAGKTTLLNIISNRIFADDGSVSIDDKPTTENDAALRRMYMMSETNCYPNQQKISRLWRDSRLFYPDFDVEYAVRLADDFGLNPSKTVKSLSTGYLSIFKVITALAVNAEFTFFDEPVLGLDANHRDLFYRRLIEKYSEKPAAYVISTHLIDEVANVIEDTIILKAGEIICHEPKDALLARGYTISGIAANVDEFCRARNVLGAEAIGGLKTAYIYGELPSVLPEPLTLSPLDLQKLFIMMTN